MLEHGRKYEEGQSLSFLQMLLRLSLVIDNFLPPSSFCAQTVPQLVMVLWLVS